MKKISRFLFVLVWLTSLISLGHHLPAAVESPDQFLKFTLGADGHLAHYNQIKDYLFRVSQQSPRVKAIILGKTTLNNDLVMALISTPENLRRIDEYTSINRRLSLAEVEKAEAEKLADQGKAVVVVACSLHSNEIGSSQMAMELAYKLATEETPETLEILNNVILALVPSANPDGQIMQVEWYNKTKGTEFEGTSAPTLYHWYAGHDNNRDWFKMSLQETKLLVREIYRRLYPQVVVDEHQMGGSGDRLFVPPYQDPPTPGLHPLVWRAINLIGSRIAYDLEMLSFPGVASRSEFTGWWIGALDDAAWFHNVPGILFEAASTQLAKPIYVEPEEVDSAESFKNEERMFSPNPWKGGWWRLRDIMNYDLHATLSVLRTAARNRREFLLNTYRAAVDNIRRGQQEAPYAYVIPREQADPAVAEKFVQVLLTANIQVHQLTHPIKVGDLVFNKKSFIVPLAQPYRPFVKNIFENQRYPDIRKSTREDPIFPYDMAGWTLPLAMGVKNYPVNEPYRVESEPVTLDTILKISWPENIDDYIILDARHNNSYAAAFALLRQGKDVSRNRSCPDFPKGSFLVRKQEAEAILRDIHQVNPLIISSKKEIDAGQFDKISNRRVALYQNWGSNTTEGWLRYVFDEFKVPYRSIRPKEVLKPGFAGQYDVIVFAGDPETEIESGKPKKKWEKWVSPRPPEYSGGIGDKGQKALQEFIKSGKTLIFMADSCDYAINKLKIPVTNVNGENSKVVCPGSYLRVNVKESDLTAGMPETAAIFFEDTPTFETSQPRNAMEERRTPLVFPDRDLLISGWLDGESALQRKSLLVDFRRGSGRIILIGPDLIHRAYSEGTFKIMFNALLTATEAR